MILSSILFSSNFTYTMPIQQLKLAQVQKATYLAQYIYDLEQLDEILQILDKSSAFKEASTTAELSVKNTNSKYSVEYLKALLEVLNGSCNKGYIKDIKDKFGLNYEIYLQNYPDVVVKNLKVIKERINNAVSNLEINLKKGENIRPILKITFENLILALNELKDETVKLKNLGVIKYFTDYEDEKYCMPKNWAQTDGKTTLSDIINFILNGDKKYKVYGIKDYYDKIYNSLKPLYIKGDI